MRQEPVSGDALVPHVSNYLKLEVPAIADNVALCRIVVAAFASQLEFTLDEIDDIKLAVSEAVSNCVLHAYPGGAGTVWIDAALDGGMLTVIVKDSGVGIEDVEAARQPGCSTDPERMGMGLTLIEALMDTLEISSAPGAGTRVSMSKRPGGGAPAN